MNIRELSKPITSKILNENMAKQFGYKLNLEQFSDVQLEDARNKLRTKLSQFELGESFDSVNESPAYQKTRAMLDCVNQSIMEREEGKCPTCHADPCKCEGTTAKKTMKKKEKSVEENYVNKTFRERAQSHSVPDAWINNALQRVELGESDRAELKAELTTRYDLNESEAGYVLLEGEEDKAEVIMATKDMVDRVTGWLEDVAAMKAEQLLELTDSIREAMGSDVAQQYTDAVKPALEAIYTALETSRQGISGALALVSGGEAPTMGASAPAMGAPGEEAMAGEPAPEAGAPGEEAMGAPEAAGRMKRESIDYSRKLGIMLSQSKKKVNEMVDPLVLALRSLQSSANNQKSTAQATWDTINQAGQQHGAPDIDYDRFAARWESDPIIKQLVARFDGQGVVIKTRQAADTPMQGTPPNPGEVSKMAKRATAKAMG